MQIVDLFEGVDPAQINVVLINMTKPLSYSLKYFQEYEKSVGYEAAISMLKTSALPVDPTLRWLAMSNNSSAKLLARYDNLFKQAMLKIKSGV